MNKSELILKLSIESDISVEAATDIINSFIDTIKSSLIEGGRVEFRGFGSFNVKEYQGYTGRNPRTGEAVTVKPKRLPTFRAGKDLKEQINS
ncbi:MAG: integration host factor subunit beta [Desulfovibrionaceae bacterium]|nr:integration host factor subunit beta [Desulfovibrionaceae bacterium]